MSELSHNRRVFITLAAVVVTVVVLHVVLTGLTDLSASTIDLLTLLAVLGGFLVDGRLQYLRRKRRRDGHERRR